MAEVLVHGSNVFMKEEVNSAVVPEIKMPEEIEIPWLVAGGIRTGLSELEQVVTENQPEALVIILRKAALLGKAIRRRLPEIPMFEAAIGRKFMARYKNLKMASGYVFDIDANDFKPIIDPNDYSLWLRYDREAIGVAEKLRADLRSKGLVNPKEIVGVNDSSHFGFTKELTWPTIAKMALGEKTVTPLVNVCKGEKFDWLNKIIKLNFGEQTGFTRMFLNEVATGRFYGSGQLVQSEADLRKIESFLREAHPDYRFRTEGDIVITRKVADYLVGLPGKIETALAEKAWV